jgi:hypothetical protein
MNALVTAEACCVQKQIVEAERNEELRVMAWVRPPLVH